jgi:phthalate 4,5-cis-dihydrodiol dehydrogenase
MTTSKPFNVGVVGLGTGAMNMLPELHANPHARIVAGADPRPQALERFRREFAGETYADAEELCLSPNVDVVYVMTPDELHARHAVAAAEAGKQVILDKPMGLSLAECDSVIEAAERNGVRVIVGHSQSLDPPNLKMAEIANSGRLGKQVMIHTLFYSDWIYRPRAKYELMQERGGSIVRRQGPIQVDILRMMGGGRVRGVRAMTSVADPERPIDGSYTAFLDFEEGHAATMTYDGYGHFNSAELTFGYTLQGMSYDPGLHVKTRQRMKGFGDPDTEEAFKESTRYGGSANRSIEQRVSEERRQAFFGLTIVSCEHGDIRQTPTGLVVHGDDGEEQIDVFSGEGFNRRYGAVEVDEMHTAMAEDRGVRIHDARWGKATQEVVLGIIQSAQERREVNMRYQVPYRGQGVS